MSRGPARSLARFFAIWSASGGACAARLADRCARAHARLAWRSRRGCARRAAGRAAQPAAMGSRASGLVLGKMAAARRRYDAPAERAGRADGPPVRLRRGRARHALASALVVVGCDVALSRRSSGARRRAPGARHPGRRTGVLHATLHLSPRHAQRGLRDPPSGAGRPAARGRWRGAARRGIAVAGNRETDRYRDSRRHGAAGGTGRWRLRVRQ